MAPSHSLKEMYASTNHNNGIQLKELMGCTHKKNEEIEIWTQLEKDKKKQVLEQQEKLQQEDQVWKNQLENEFKQILEHQVKLREQEKEQEKQIQKEKENNKD